MRRQAVPVIRSLLLLAAAFLATVSTATADVALEQLDAARERWSEAGIGSYRYTYQKFCACYSGEPPEVVVTVTDGQVTRAYSRHDYSDREVPAGDDRLDLYWTIEDLFRKLDAAYARGVRVEADYDAEFGFPRRVFIDDFADFTGEETDLRFTAFEAL